MRSSTKTLRPRGRPREYDPEAALEAALRLFWRKGYAATSLDDLSRATKMSRPSLYAAFGDKEALYLKTLARFAERVGARFAAALERSGPEDDVSKQVTRFLKVGLELYTAGVRDGLGGCMVLSTAAAESACEAPRSVAAAVVEAIDGEILRALRDASERGELRADAELPGLAAALGALLHSLSLRARCGRPVSELQSLVKVGAALVAPYRRAP